MGMNYLAHSLFGSPCLSQFSQNQESQTWPLRNELTSRETGLHFLLTTRIKHENTRQISAEWSRYCKFARESASEAPRYLADHLIPASDAAPRRRRRLRSANLNRLTVPRCRLSTYGCRAFYYAGPAVWNSLPDELRNTDSFDSFKRFLKTILFSCY